MERGSSFRRQALMLPQHLRYVFVESLDCDGIAIIAKLSKIRCQIATFDEIYR